MSKEKHRTIITSKKRIYSKFLITKKVFKIFFYTNKESFQKQNNLANMMCIKILRSLLIIAEIKVDLAILKTSLNKSITISPNLKINSYLSWKYRKNSQKIQKDFLQIITVILWQRQNFKIMRFYHNKKSTLFRQNNLFQIINPTLTLG